MKYLVVLLFVALAAARSLTPEEKEKLINLSTKCKASSGVDAAVIEKVKSEKKLVEGDDKFDAYITCLLAKVINADGTINAQAIKDKVPAHLDQGKAFDVIDKCSDIPAGHDTARKALKCFGGEIREYLAQHA